MLICIYFGLLYSATTTVIHRPHGDSMLVIRPSVIKHKQRPSTQYTHQHITKKPAVTQTTSSTIKTPTKTPHLPNFTNSVSDLDTAASISTGKFTMNFSTRKHLSKKNTQRE